MRTTNSTAPHKLHDVSGCVACPELAVVEWLTTGTPRGGTRYEVQGCDVLALRNGKISAKRSYRKGQL